MPEAPRRLQAQAKGIGFCRESNHCEYFIKSNSFCSRNMEAKFTPSFRNVCDCSHSCSQCHLSSGRQLNIGELTREVHPPRVASPTSRPPFTWKQVNMSSHSSTRPPSVFAVEPELLHILRDEASLRPEGKKEDKKEPVQWLGQSGGTEIFFSLQSSSPKNRSDQVPSFYFPVCTWPLLSLWLHEYVGLTVILAPLSMPKL